ncbi:MAG: aspartate carbamoyltransferase catalytic subunit [Megasphaera sp.]|jgi:aspartate carbamoyltransferase catalytic subunit|nr:aspartate carbamoyltransferase catalytic subunit [Megasphaera sp.]MCI1247559.1 aspartate carbamoyltransferase catalytic subunit [Megasphaera sp.]
MISLQGKSLLGLQGVPREEIELILRVARKMKKVIDSGDKKLSLLKGKSVCNMFWEPSTRTRGSFEMAAKYLGADVINFTPRGSSIQKGESFRDTLLTVMAMGVDAIVMRHKQEGSAVLAHQCVSPLIINAGDGAHEHPTQALLDLFTMQDVKGHIDGLKVVIVGDIDHGRVARSNIYGLKTLGADVHLVGPRTLLQPELEAMGVTVHYNLDEALEGADVINVLRIQRERQGIGFFPSAGEYNSLFGINAQRIQKAKKDVLILHPGPMNRGIEIGTDVCYGEHSSIQEQVKNGVSVRMAILYLTIIGGDDVDTTR